MDPRKIHRQWIKWVKNKTHIRSKLSPTKQRKADHFMTTHAASEAALRRLIFIGLRKKEITYKAASDWINHHHFIFGKTKARSNFINYFENLYGFSWPNLMRREQDLDELWELWHGFAKPIRNHLAHGVRKYDDDWYDHAIAIDRLFMIRLNAAINPEIGGSPFAHLKHLSPKLPRGESSNDPDGVLGLKMRGSRPRISLSDAKARMGQL